MNNNKEKTIHQLLLDMQLGQNKEILNVSTLQVRNEARGQILMVLMGYVRGLEQRYSIFFQNLGVPEDY